MKKHTGRLLRLLAAMLAALAIFTLAACSSEDVQTAIEIAEIAESLAESDSATATPQAEPGAAEDGTKAKAEADTEAAQATPPPTATPLPEDGTYTGKEEVALYIHTYGRLPGNFITKKQAQVLGWPGGELEPYAPGKCIGGSHYGNYEGLLPEADGRSYTECDIDTLGAKTRGAKRIVFSNDGLIYYTDDHYQSFELLYGEP